MVKKVKKKRIKVIPCLILLLSLIFFSLIVRLIYNSSTENIFISGNELLNDQEIIDLAKLTDYPRFFKYRNKTIVNNIKRSELVKDVEVTRSFYNVFNIKIVEYKVLFYDFSSSQYVLSNGTMISDDELDSRGYPTLLNYVADEVYDKFLKKLDELDDNIINQISEIKYEPSNYDNSRFLLKMNDGNYVYINIPNFKSLNLYNDIYPNFDNHIGILYLDSGYGEASEYKIIK